NQSHRPVMIHRAPFGSLERFMSILIEHTAGKFPLWLAPEQYVIIPVSEPYHDFAFQVRNRLGSVDIKGEVDDRNETIGRRIRDAEVKKMPFMLIVGEEEQNADSVSVRRHGEGQQGRMTIADFIAFFEKEKDS